ncbi:Similar to Ankyrin repeat domain-containing protein 50; acc. no. Q9ULJ7 [Pyronema omphalodes CBS 100304]|uniref:Similar to Ankyrin repeat domain-containing protein 50 acc. no. Q9ULJ7 n=1 Tax=Pyronema omphalodes (strain CBS 100304) TaxID=1076935 RepID=U4L3G1_PYROM|nr:Similar to Ankyrin repeat domain-containing protein 50; acc. no. Q9ULJ7 [Pyronema omphalodes CBS 100304]
MNEHLASSLMEFAGVHIIAYFGLDEIYEALVKKLDNLDINRKILWKTALLLAVEQGHYAVVRQLIEVEGIDIDPKNEDGGTPLFCAAEHGDEAIVRLLFEKGAQVDPKDNEERTPLFYAA